MGRGWVAGSAQREVGGPGHPLTVARQSIAAIPDTRGVRVSFPNQRRLGRRLEEVAKAVGGGYCRLQMPLKPALADRETAAGRWLGGLEAGGGGSPPSNASLPLPSWGHPLLAIRRAMAECSGACCALSASCPLWVPAAPHPHGLFQ